jgi:hypothetical protein
LRPATFIVPAARNHPGMTRLECPLVNCKRPLVKPGRFPRLSAQPQQRSQIIERTGDIGMFRPEQFFFDSEGRRVKRLRFVELALRVFERCQIVEV